MSPRAVLRSAPLLLALGLAAAPALVPSAAHAAGFSQPVVLSGTDDVDADVYGVDPQVVIAPNGRTAVLYARSGKQAGYRLAIGPSPDRLGPPATLEVVARARGGNARLFARPDGGFVVCFSDATRRHTGQAGCSIASPTSLFGPMIPLPGDGVLAAMRPDGSTVLVLSTITSKPNAKTQTSTTSVAVLGTDGVVSAPHPVADDAATAGDGATALVVTGDGTAAMPADIPIKGTKYGKFPGVRLMPPGADTFGPAIPVSSQRSENGVTVIGGPNLVVGFQNTFNSYGEGGYEQRYVRRLADGSFGPPQALPGSQTAAQTGAIVSLPSGELFALASYSYTAYEDQDCFNPVEGSITAGPLNAVGTTTAAPQISNPRQIAINPHAAVLADGTVIAQWANAAGYDGTYRLQTAIRTPHGATFSRPQTLPQRESDRGTVTLAAGGSSAALVWSTDGPHDRTRLMISALRKAGPYAKLAALPKHPAAVCDGE